MEGGVGTEIEGFRTTNTRKRKNKSNDKKSNNQRTNEKPAQLDETNTPKQRIAKFTEADARLDSALTDELFFELREDEDEQPSTKKQKQKKHEQQNNLQQQEDDTTEAQEEEDIKSDFKLEEDDEEEEVKAAWEDEDDEVLVTAPKKIQLPNKVLSGKEYQQKLRNRHKLQSLQSDDWAQLKKPKKKRNEDEYDEGDSDDDGDAILYRSQPLVVPDSRLLPSLIKAVSKHSSRRHQSAVRRVSIHPIQPIAMTIDGNTVKVYRLGEKIQEMHSVRMQDMDILDACFSADGSQIFMCGNQPSLYILEVGSGKINFLRSVLGKNEKRFSKIYPSPDGKSCVLLAGSGSILIISTISKKLIKELRGPSNSVYSAAFAPDGRLFASYAGGVVLAWDMQKQLPTHTFTNPSLQFSTAMAISPDGQYIALGSSAGMVDVFLVKDVLASSNPKLHVSLDNLVTSVSCIKFNHDSQIMAIASDIVKTGLRLVHVPSFEIYKNWPTETDGLSLVKDVSFSPAGGYMLVGSNTGRIKMIRFPHYPAA